MRSLAVRLALLLAAITTAAIVAVYLYVVPPLASGLRADETSSLVRSSGEYAAEVQRVLDAGSPNARIGTEVRQVAEAAGSHATLLAVGANGALRQIQDSSASRHPISSMPTATEAARSGRTESRSMSGPHGSEGEVSVPLRDDHGRIEAVLVLTKPMSDVERHVKLVSRRFFSAGIVALVVATLLGVAVAASLRRRIERIRRAARSIAQGDFSARFDSSSRDELGRLALELEDMRHQLAGLDEARSRFIATASHELRTPIFSLGGFLELLADEDVDDETRTQFLAQLRGQVDRLAKLAVGLLDLSRLESGALELRPEPVDVGAIARGVADEFAPRLAAHDSRISVQLGRDPLSAVCDPERVAQVLRILVDNAIAHTPRGTTLTVSAAREADALRIAVRDTAGAIDPATLPSLFEPFTTAGGTQGAGLGLAIARELAEHMGGTLTGDVAPGSTTFTFRTPDGAPA